MIIPDLTHLQFVFITALRNGRISRKELRSKLEVNGMIQSATASHAYMYALERLGYIIIHRDKETSYELTEKAHAEWHKLHDFYTKEQYKCK